MGHAAMLLFPHSSRAIRNPVRFLRPAASDVLFVAGSLLLRFVGFVWLHLSAMSQFNSYSCWRSVWRFSLFLCPPLPLLFAGVFPFSLVLIYFLFLFSLSPRPSFVANTQVFRLVYLLCPRVRCSSLHGMMPLLYLQSVSRIRLVVCDHRRSPSLEDEASARTLVVPDVNGWEISV